MDALVGRAHAATNLFINTRRVNFVDPSGPMKVIRNATPEYQDLSRILQQLHSLAYAFFGSTPRFSSNDGSPEGLMANKVRGIVGHGLRTPFPSGSP